MRETSRRGYLRRSAAVALAAVAGCLGSEDPADRTTATPADGGSGPASATPTETDMPTARPGTGTETETPTPTDEPETDTPTDEPGAGTSAPSGAVAWRTALDDAVTATPVIDDGSVYAGDESGAVRRHGVDAGEVRWRFDAGVPIQDLAVGGETVFVVSGTDELGSDQTLHALDAGSGAERWTHSPTNWWLELLAVADGTVYVSTADDALGPEGETLYALDADGGTQRWSAEVGDPREAVLTGDSIFVSTFGRIDAFDRASGDARWERDVEDVTYTTPAVVDGTMVYAYSDYDESRYGVLVGLDAATGEERWQFHGASVTSTVVEDGTLYVGGGVAALDPPDGSPLWQVDRSGFVTEAGVTDDRVYAGGDTVQVYGRDGGDLLWEWTPDPAQDGAFAAGHGDGTALFDAYHDADPRNQYKFAVDTADGGQRWAFEDGTELTDLAIGDDFAVVGGKNGRLYGLDVTAEP